MEPWLGSWQAELALVVLTALLLLWVCLLRHFSFWSMHRVPQVQPWTAIGNCRRSLIGAKMLIDDLDDIYRNFRAEPYAGFYRYVTPGLILIDPNLIQQVLVSDFNCFTDEEDALVSDPLLIDNLLNMKREQLWSLWHKLSPMLTSDKFKERFLVINECGWRLGNSLYDSATRNWVVDFRDTCALYTIQVIGSLTFGLKPGCIWDPNCAFHHWARTMLDTQPRSIKGAQQQEVFAFFHKMAKETLDQRLESEINSNDFMELFIQLHKSGFIESKKNVDTTWKQTEDTVVAQAFLFYMSCFEMSSMIMSFTLYELAVNPDIQQRVQTEVQTVLLEAGEVTYEALTKMKYLDMVLSETVRKYPPVTVFTRKALRPYHLPPSSACSGGVLLDKGQVVTVPVYSLHHDPHHYPDPKRFDPERFSEEGKAHRHPYAYMPFGEGPHFCIGMNFGLLQAKVGLQQLLYWYRVEVTKDTDIPLRFAPSASLLIPKNGIRLLML